MLNLTFAKKVTKKNRYLYVYKVAFIVETLANNCLLY